MEIISIGHLNYIPCSMISGIYNVDSRPMRTMISSAKKEKKLITATKHKKTKTAIVLKNGFIVLSSISANTLANRFEGKVAKTKFSGNLDEFAEEFSDELSDETNDI